MANHCKEKIKSNFGIHETNDDIIGGGEKYSASVVYQIQFLNVKFDRLAYEYVKLNVNINPRMLTERNKTDRKKHVKNENIQSKLFKVKFRESVENDDQQWYWYRLPENTCHSQKKTY